MLRTFLRSKIHMASVTEANIYYKGSITIDEEIMDAAGLLPYEQVSVSNLNNGERFDTYVIPAPRGSRMICLNGPAGRKGAVGDRIVIFAYCLLTNEEIPQFKPTIVFLDEFNNIIRE